MTRNSLTYAVASLLSCGMLHAAAPAAKPPVQGFAAARIQEKLGRGLIAQRSGEGPVHLSWRLLRDDPADAGFHVYRQVGNEALQRLTTDTVRRTTDYVDAAPASGEVRYCVRAVIDGKEQPESERVAVLFSEETPYRSIKLAGNHTFQKIAIADLDGDGQHDFVIKQPNANVDPYEKYWKKSPGTYTLEAYRHDGKLLWTYDMGWAIEQGIWYSPYIVYDLDGDGCAEVALKSGEGDPRDADGRVQSGPEYLSVLDGRTGKPITRIDWPARSDFPSYNYASRNQLGIAYLDGRTPCLLVNRGTYNTIHVLTYQFHLGKLRQLWKWTDAEGGPAYRGQGAHCLRAADIDDDGRDEVIFGSGVIDDNGQALWSTRLGHPDHMTVGDLDPNRPGLEIHYGIEPKRTSGAICMVDARTGKILWSLQEPTQHVHSQGLCADIDPAHPGCECYGGERDFADKRWLFSATGTLLGNKDLGGLSPKAAYWDADPQRELIRDSQARKFDGQRLPGRIEGTIIAVADVVGDWREEVITTEPGELRIYSTLIPATDRRPCLMQDPIYRLDVATGSQAYYQIPGLRVLPGTEK